MTRNLSTEAKVTPTGLQQEIGMGPALAARIKTVTNHAALEAIVPTSGAPTFYCTGHTSAGDGGEGVWRWVAGNSDTANGGTILGSDAAGRWKRAFSGPVNVRWFASFSAFLTYLSANPGTTAYLPSGTYDGTGLTIPGGISLVGDGTYYHDTNGFENTTIISGNPTIGTSTKQGGSFTGIVFSDGARVIRMGVTFDLCGFSGTLHLDQSAGAVYYTTVRSCYFRGVSGGPCIRLTGQANANTITSCRLAVADGQRGIEMVASGSDKPTINTIVGNAIESDTTGTIGSFIYGTGIQNYINGNYCEVGSGVTFDDGAGIVLVAGSSNNRLYLSGTDTSHINDGSNEVFYAKNNLSAYKNNNTSIDNSGMPLVLVLGPVSTAFTLPNLSSVRSRSVIIYNQSTNCELTAASGEDFAYATTGSTITLGKEEVWLFTHRYGNDGTNVTRWYPKKLSENHQKSTFADGDATPSVVGAQMWETANTTPTTITDLDDLKYGEEKLIYFGDSNTTIQFSGSHFQGNQGSDWTPSAGDYMRCWTTDTNLIYCWIVDDTP